MAAPDLLDITSIYGKTAVQNVTTTATAIVSNSAGSGKLLKIASLYVTNIDGTAAANITVDLLRGAGSYSIASTISVPADATIVVVSKDSAIYLEEGDSLRGLASANGDLQIVCSYEEIS